MGVGGFVPVTASLRQHVDKGTMNFIFGGNGFFGYFYADSAPSAAHRDSAYHVSEPGDRMAWWSTYAMDDCPTDPRHIDRDAVAAQLRERHRGWADPVVQDIITGERTTIESVYPTWTAPELPTWERDGVVLVGDAAHALPPTSGQGSSQALEDVEAFTLFLAHELRDAYRAPSETQMLTEKSAVTTAAKRYMALRQPHVKRILDHARRMQNNKRDMTVVEEWIMYAVMWIMGFFPSVMGRDLKTVTEYNIRDEVERLLEQQQSSSNSLE